MQSPFVYLCTVHRWPLPSGVEFKFHYFRSKRRAVDFAGKIDGPVDVTYLAHGATLLKPVSLVTLELDGIIYDCRQEFGYEMELEDVNEAWLDSEGLGCDCARCDVILRNCYEGVPRLGCGHSIKRLSMATIFECCSGDFVLH